jgi:hypothetical protein
VHWLDLAGPRDVGGFAADARQGFERGATAGQMAEIMDAVGGDGFLIMDPDFARRYITEIADGLTPNIAVTGGGAQEIRLRDGARQPARILAAARNPGSCLTPMANTLSDEPHDQPGFA